ncbi:MAG: type toxin-antitoxin system PemK/MazF family toxin [Sphingobacteriaceae bacterium]|jgi:mRNA interferase MazF|nr:type toxin-antitoxin system PemK/MazF family toxin [Sphingobacteriaceae bacterium]
MTISRLDICLIDFNPARGTMSGKIRPALVIQTNGLNKVNHPSTIVIPLSSQSYEKTSLLRYKILPTETNGLEKISFAVIDQLTTVDNRKIKSRLGSLDKEYREPIVSALKVILDL